MQAMLDTADFYTQIIYEDNHLIAVNKRSGILVQPDQTNAPTLADAVKEYIKQKYDKPGGVFLGTVHRIDRPVSGLVLFARTTKALERMNALFRNREIQKTYWAIVKQKPPKEQAKLTHWLTKDESQNIATAYDYPEEGALKSELTYRLMGKLNEHYLLEVNPITGRPHQIRVQLASIGCPIRGDVKYGYPHANGDRSICLHARRAYFTHPVRKEPLVLTAGVPEIPFWEQFLSLEKPNVKDKNIDFIY